MTIDQQTTSAIEELHKIAQEILSRAELQSKREKIGKLEGQMTDPDFWGDPQRAKDISQELSDLRDQLSLYEKLEKEMEDIEALKTLTTEAKGEELQEELGAAITRYRKHIDGLESMLYFSGKYDTSEAILSIHSGQGGTEAMDWASMLQRMYTRYFERRGWKFALVEESRGEEAGIKSCTYLVHGPFAYGYLKRESGVHRLVRQSPFNADSLRQTSFSGIEVLPLVDDTSADVSLNPSDLEWKFSRAGGHGGQNVNKVNTAVLLKHIPTGITVEAREERYQEQNRKIALTILKSKLAEIEEKKQREEMARVKGDHKLAAWGNQIRNYVLHPYHLVKDLRTGVETSDTQSVLDGDLDMFIAAEVKL